MTVRDADAAPAKPLLVEWFTISLRDLGNTGTGKGKAMGAFPGKIEKLFQVTVGLFSGKPGIDHQLLQLLGKFREYRETLWAFKCGVRLQDGKNLETILG